jgi:hypothetical protein
MTRTKPPPAADPLAVALRTAARQTRDPLVRDWFRALLRGQGTSSAAAAKEAGPRREAPAARQGGAR